MGKLTDLYENFKKMNDSKAVQKQTFKILRDNPRILLTPQRRQLFFRSQDAEGGPLGFYKIYRGDPNEIESAKARDQQGQPFDMVYSGQFRRGLFQVVTHNAIYISSSTPHLESMTKNVGNVFLSTNFFGITDENMRDMVKPRLLEKLLPWMVNYMLKLPIVT